ncbi:hypothetical protein XENOCAPTIV_014748, partial [Xenoophorus captivus]
GWRSHSSSTNPEFPPAASHLVQRWTEDSTKQSHSLCWAPHTSSARFGTAPCRHLSFSVCLPTPIFLFADPPDVDAVAVRTLSPLLWSFGQAPPYPSRRVWPKLLPIAWRPRLRFLVPSFAPVPSSGSQRKNKACFAPSVQPGDTVQTVSRPQSKSAALHGSSLVWLLLGLLIMEPVSRTLQCF